jgi:hypothetical protein
MFSPCDEGRRPYEHRRGMIIAFRVIYRTKRGATTKSAVKYQDVLPVAARASQFAL